ncbi:NAD(P)H dehydrogenase (quinone) [Ancylomarina subtilis]|uniref:NAD(P)H dehydrogenase (Quinone) n=1 Tax=Ancylomarina subtilis TaxID=1639035 RepID=A0A4Q7VIT4_9BACT|nr:SDR family oxidoreductase [Ancylomarina subtilis]RZT96052.1 NAD(P)H dehydrogenase (quinone) [Ancylomarina subtilis]
MNKILITGASGQLGKSVIKHLLNKVEAKNLAVLVRNEEKASDLKPLGIDVRIGDYTNYESLLTAFKGIDKLYFISGSDFEGRSKQHENVVNAAKEVGVKHVVYTSFMRKDESSASPISFVVADHIETEIWLQESGMNYTFLRHNLYMDMLPLFMGENVLKTGVIYQPAGNGKVAFTLREDMAEVASHILTSKGHENKTYDITSDKAYSYNDIASILTDITGKTIAYSSPSVEEFNKTMTEAGVPEMYISLFAGFAQAMEQGELDHCNSVMEQLIGRKATSMADYLREVYS